MAKKTKRIVKHIAKIISPKYDIYSGFVLKNRLNSLFSKTQEHKYLFILSPPYCGSTLLTQIISSASAVSVNNKFGTQEGQTLPTVRNMMFEDNRRWNRNVDYDWAFIKKEWRKYWNLSSPILLDKSPPNIMRAQSIETNFVPSHFIIFHRNPYAHCESLMRRSYSNPNDAAIFAIKCLTHQKENLNKLKRKIQISYEDLTINTAIVEQSLKQFLPELNDVRFDQEFSSHNYLQQKMKIVNLNKDKISKLSSSDLNKINEVFRKNKDVLDYFKYDIIE